MRTIELLLEDKPNYFVREAFNTLRTNILFSGRDVKTIVVTSCIAHEGKSTVSLELCRSLAEGGKKVLLIDADMRKSVMANRYTKDRGIMGLSQLLSGQATLDQTVNHTQIPMLDVIFAGPYPPNPMELAGSPAFQELIDSTRPDYDYVIVDAPPLGMVIDAAVMASCCDGAVLIVKAGGVKYRVAQAVKAQLLKSGCRILGVILNQVHMRESSGGGSFYGANYNTYYGKHSKSAGQTATAKAESEKPAQKK